MKHWIGLWMIGVSIIHTLFAVVVFKDTLAGIGRAGIYNSIGTDPMRGGVVWFLFAGAYMFVCGLAITALEKTPTAILPKSLGWSLLAFTVCGVVLMPASGFWLFFPPVIALLIKKRKGPETARSTFTG